MKLTKRKVDEVLFENEFYLRSEAAHLKVVEWFIYDFDERGWTLIDDKSLHFKLEKNYEENVRTKTLLVDVAQIPEDFDLGEFERILEEGGVAKVSDVEAIHHLDDDPPMQLFIAPDLLGDVFSGKKKLTVRTGWRVDYNVGGILRLISTDDREKYAEVLLTHIEYHFANDLTDEYFNDLKEFYYPDLEKDTKITTFHFKLMN